MVKVEVARKGGVRKTFDVKLQALNDSPQVAARRTQGDADDAAAPSGVAMNRLGHQRRAGHARTRRSSSSCPPTRAA